MPEPSTIPDGEVWEGSRRVVVGPPRGHDVTGNIRPIEALVLNDGLGPRFATRWVFTPEEAERLSRGEPLWISQWTPQMVVFDVAMMSS